MREHSGVELRRKLAPHAESAEQLEDLLQDLASLGLFSEARFAQGLVRRRSERYGLRRIAVELDGHRIGPALSAESLRGLADTELDRAFEVWRRRFGTPPADLPERARQHRFLAQRGFAGDVIRQVFRRAETTPDAPD